MTAEEFKKYAGKHTKGKRNYRIKQKKQLWKQEV